MDKFDKIEAAIKQKKLEMMKSLRDYQVKKMPLN
jgi:hypothetical protein